MIAPAVEAPRLRPGAVPLEHPRPQRWPGATWVRATRPANNRRRRWWLVGGVATAAVLVLALFILSPLLGLGGARATNDPVAVARVTLEPDPSGTAVVLVLLDRQGRDAPLNGELALEIREPDGARWNLMRTVTPAEFGLIGAGSLLAGRLGFRTVIPPTAWTRPPRRGGQVSIGVTVTPAGSNRFAQTATDTFP